jgi:hypothetical protein
MPDAPAHQPLHPDPPARRVAVIGVHGVAHHDPGATANAMADLLLSLPADHHDHPRNYDSFRAVGIQVPLQRLDVGPAEAVQDKNSMASKFSFREKSAEFAAKGAQFAPKAPGKSAQRGQAGQAYMRLVLQNYPGGADGDAYVTTRLEGNRAPGSKRPGAEVHIYEVLWADLARPTNTFLSFFLSLFQLLFHLGTLSALAIDTGAAENNTLVWRAFRTLQRYAVRMLQLFIPLLKIVLLIALFSCLPALAKSTQGRIWFPLVGGGIAGLVIAFLANRTSTRKLTMSPWTWSLLAIAPAALGVAAAGAASHWIANDILSAVECWLILGLALLFFILDKYKVVRQGAAPLGWLFFIACFVMFCVFLSCPAPGPKAGHPASEGDAATRVAQATVWTVQWAVAAVRVSWIFFFIFAFAALVLGTLAWRSIPRTSPGPRARARAAVRTTRFALALPAILFVLVTTLLWAGLFSIARTIHNPIMPVESLTSAPGGAWLTDYNLVPDPKLTQDRTEKMCNAENWGCLKTDLATVKPLSEGAYHQSFPSEESKGAQLHQVTPVPGNDWKNARPDYLEDVLVWSAGGGFPLTLGLFALGLLLLFWWALPSVFSENYRQRDEKKPPRPTTNAVSLRFGTWLSRGLDATSVITFLFWIAIFLVPPLFLPGVTPWKWFHATNDLANFIAKKLGTGTQITEWIVKSFAVGGASAVVAIAVKYGSPVLGAILDVDTYLRNLPDDATPRAKIMERFVSLLRYIARYRDADGRPYDSVVIVAHSLGSLISADLLRFLKECGDPELKVLGLAGAGVSEKPKISIKLLTMGSPIRQLLNRFFPYLYDWVRDEPDNGLRPLPAPTAAPPAITAATLPDPRELGLETWANVYRSGDYVGRSLWLDEWYCRTAGLPASGKYPQPLYRATAAGREEACIGAGAHTRYWDDTAPDVAEILNELI